MDKLIGREKELDILNSAFVEEKSNIILINGQKGIGKRRLIKEFIKSNQIETVYFNANSDREKDNRESFKRCVLNYTGFTSLMNVNLNWDTLFRCFSTCKKESKKVLIIDGLDFLLKSNSSFLSEIKKMWNDFLFENNVLLILMGELLIDFISPFINEMFDKIIELKPLPFFCYKSFFPEKPHKELIKIFAFTGGIPLYMELFENKTIVEAINDSILNQKSVFYNEPIYFLLKRKKQNVSSLISILKYIAMNYHTQYDLRKLTNKSISEIAKCLNHLMSLRIIYKEHPVYDLDKLRSKFSTYQYLNPFFNLWFKLNYLFQSEIDFGNVDIALQYVQNGSLNDLIEKGYTRLCYQILEINKQAYEIQFQYIGKIYEEDNQVDLVAVNPEVKNIIIGDTSYLMKEKTVEDLDNLIQVKKSIVKRKYEDYQIVKYVIFSDYGFSKELEYRALKHKNIILINTSKI